MDLDIWLCGRCYLLFEPHHFRFAGTIVFTGPDRACSSGRDGPGRFFLKVLRAGPGWADFLEKPFGLGRWRNFFLNFHLWYTLSE